MLCYKRFVQSLPSLLKRTSILALAAVLGLVACGGGSGSAPPVKTIAFLRAVAGGESDQVFLGELQRAGYEKGRNLRILAADPAETHPDPTEAAQVVRGWVTQGVDLILAFSSRGALAARSAAPNTTIVFLVNNPVAVGLVQREDMPEGRLTGVTFRVPADRTLALARRAMPSATRTGLIYSSTDPAAEPHRRAVAEAARGLGITLVEGSFADDAGVAPAVTRLIKRKVDYIFISNSPTGILARTLIQKAVRGRVPIVANTTVVDFAIMTLDPDVEELYRQLARQTARLLDGSDPSSVPVEDPRRYRVVLNQGVATDFGITFPPDLVREADRVVP